MVTQSGPDPDPMDSPMDRWTAVVDTVGWWLTAPTRPVASRPTIVKVLVAHLALIGVFTGLCGLTMLISVFIGGEILLLIPFSILGLITVNFVSAARGLWIGDSAAADWSTRLLTGGVGLSALGAGRALLVMLRGDFSVVGPLIALVAAAVILVAPLLLLRNDRLSNQVREFVWQTGELRSPPRVLGDPAPGS